MASDASAIEITVVSAQGLRKSSSFPFFWKRLRAYATVNLSIAAPCRSPLLGCRIRVEDELSPVYSTRTDDQGGTDPRWNEECRIPVDSRFLEDARWSICVRIYTRGGSQLGWCRIPVEDMVISPPGKLSYLSYRLRDPMDGTKSHGIVNVAVKLDGLLENAGCLGLTSLDTRQAVIGIPVSLPRSTGQFRQHHHQHHAVR